MGFLNNSTCEQITNETREWNEDPIDNRSLVLIEGYILVGIGLVGIFGNIFTVFVILLQKEMRASIYCLLLGLAVSDTIVVVSSIFVYGLTAFTDYYPALWPVYRKEYAAIMMVIMYPFLYTGQTASILFVMAVTVERFLSVKYPLKSRSWCSWGKATKVAVGIFLLAIAYNVPRWWEYTQRCVWWPEDKEFIYRIRFRLRSHPTYALVYVNFMFLIFMQIIPFTAISVLNLIIYKEVRRANRVRQLLSKSEMKEINLAKMFICIAVIFLTCNIPFLVCNGHEGFIPDVQVSTLWYVGDLFVIVNSSVNFLIYCLYGKRFRAVFLRRLSAVVPGFRSLLLRTKSVATDITLYNNRKGPRSLPSPAGGQTQQS